MSDIHIGLDGAAILARNLQRQKHSDQFAKDCRLLATHANKVLLPTQLHERVLNGGFDLTGELVRNALLAARLGGAFPFLKRAKARTG
jgi:hypothetical protein